MDGQITLHFDQTHRRTFNREDSRHILQQIEQAQKVAA
jgi:hypothetical protein